MNNNIIANYIPVTSWPEKHKWPSVAGLRNLIFNADKNGFNRCIRRIGRRILIDEGAFFTWVDQHGSGGAK